MLQAEARLRGMGKFRALGIYALSYEICQIAKLANIQANDCHYVGPKFAER